MMDIAIFGGGIAGLMTAITLGAQGHCCTVYERTREGNETGMGFILMPDGIDCLQSFGVKLTGENSGASLQRYFCRSSTGQILYEQPLPPGTRSIRRRHLIDALMGALPADSGLLFDAELAGLDFDDAGNVTQARLNTGAILKADLYVSAEGIRSRARQALFPGWLAPQAQVLEIVGMVQCKSTVRWVSNNFNKFHAVSGGIALGTLAVDDEHVIWYVQFDSQRFPQPPDDATDFANTRRSFVSSLVGAWADPIPHLLSITNFSRTHVWRPVDTDLIPTFYRGNLVLVGDAAHPLSPFTSQGVSSAIADAVTLAENLPPESLKTQADLEHALSTYSAERRKQCAPYVAKGRELTRHFLTPEIGSNILLPMAEPNGAQPGSFSDNIIRVDLLRERAFNMRWAQQPADVIPLTAADPDFPICPVIQEQLVRHVRDGVLSYGPAEGLPQFRESVARWMLETRQMPCKPEEVFATDSAASGMAVLARASLAAGDEVLIPDPVDFLLHHTVERAGAVPVRVRVKPETNAEEFIRGMESRLTARTRMLWLCNPHNPLGVVYSREWQQRVAEWAISRGLRIVSDEIWSDIVYTPHRHVSLASISPEIASNTVTVYGFSKNFALAGLRVGCLICPDPDWKKEIVAASDAESTVYGASVLSQVAVVAALNDGREWLAEFVQHLHAQRDYVVGRLAKWPGVTVQPPQGTYVVFPEVRSLTDNSEDLCQQLREQARVALVPGAPRWFGPGASGHLRICFATSHRILREAFDRLEPVVTQIANERQQLKVTVNGQGSTPLFRTTVA
ncbi:MAG TPA: aminotransferase class I/II-fold pyridoxal phosphate-dependent enzyme [Candidatus Angelobacter sp.]|jgi:aspartate/methionine/tyrosine aminotransferase/2-polyprenyl-6-methoxyphenol hydroxylase-like FAD-dependent oxidoreductase|nr:aminotransferase class I/II-fold pyridoxal phosphate-dependent enzyme [Candidatus Angelobacter sp.]